jgi:hypothetical protein
MNRRPAAATVNEPSPPGPARSTTPGTCLNRTQCPGSAGPRGARAPEAHAVSARPSARPRDTARGRCSLTTAQAYGAARRQAASGDTQGPPERAGELAAGPAAALAHGRRSQPGAWNGSSRISATCRPEWSNRQPARVFVRGSTPMTASAVVCEDGHGPFLPPGTVSGRAGLEGNTVRQICDEPRACGSDGVSGQSCHARIYDRLGNLHLLVSAGAMTQAFTMGNMESSSPAATKAGWVMQGQRFGAGRARGSCTR